MLLVIDFSKISHIEDILKLVQKETEAALSSEALIGDTAKCIAKSGNFWDSELCWSEFKHQQALKILDSMDALSREDTIGFAQRTHYAPHKLFLPTHQCNMLKLQRFAGHYATTPEAQHPDGPKWMCPEYLATPADTKCVIFSVGSNGDFQFEESMRAFVGDRCNIFTFDCTGNWTNPSTQFHPWCISDENKVDNGRIYKTLSKIMQDVNVPHIHLFKIDVEGYEFQTVKTLMQEPPENLPRQILMEVHFGSGMSHTGFDAEKDTWVKPATEFYRNMDKMGYRIAVRELNIYSDCCSEYVFVRNP
nr:hypothetical protein HK105_000781 [Polyrhizophydium stewartii]